MITAAALSALTFSTQPSGTVTAGSLFSPAPVVTATDKYGNVVPNATIAIKNTTGTALSAGSILTSPTNSSGQASFYSLKENIVGTYTLTATYTPATGSPVTTASGSYVVTPATGLITFTVQPDKASPSVKASDNDLSAVVVTIADVYGNVVPGSSVTLTLSPTGTVSPGYSSVATGSDGTATFSSQSVYTVGTYTLIAYSGTLTPVRSTPFTITPAAVATLFFSTQPSGSVIAGSKLNPSPVVAATDQYGNLVPKAIISIQNTSGPALSVTGSSLLATTNVSGLATFSSLKENIAGTYGLTATYTPASGPAVTTDSFGSYVVTPATGLITFTVQPNASTGPAQAGTNDLSAVVVTIADTYGNVVPGSNVNLTISPAAALSPGYSSVATQSDGTASFDVQTVTKLGTYRLIASSSGLTPVYSSPFTITAAAPFALTLANQPQNQTAGSIIKAAPTSPSKFVTVQVVDQFGNPCPAPTGDQVSMSIAYTNSLASVTQFSGGGPFSFGSTGQAVFSTLLENTSGTYTLTAGDTNGLVSVQSKSFVISSALPFSLSMVNGPASTSAGSLLNTTPITLPLPNGLGTAQLPAGVSLQLEDKYSNPVSGVSITTSISSISGSVSTPTTFGSLIAPLVTNSLGVVTFGNLTENKDGSYKLNATSPTLHSTSSLFTISSAAPYGLTFTVQPTNTQATKTLSSVTVQIIDKFGNPVAQSDLVSLALSSAKVSFLGGIPSVQANNSGAAVFSGLQVTTTGTYTMLGTTTIADSQGNSQNVSTMSKSFTITPGPAVNMAFTTQPANGQFVNSMLGATTGTVIVQLLDIYGNNVNQPNVQVAITITDVTTGKTYGAKKTKLTNSLGQAVVSLTLFAASTYELTATSSLVAIPPALSNPFVVTQASQRWY